MKLDLCLFASTPDIQERGFVVPVLTGTAEQLAVKSLAAGYAGFEFLPHPERVPDAKEFRLALQRTGAILPVVNTGRLHAHGLALFHADSQIAQRGRKAFERILMFAGEVGASVGLGIARGAHRSDLTIEQMNVLAENLFCELAETARVAGTRILLEAAETNVTRFILDLQEVMHWSDRINRRVSGRQDWSGGQIQNMDGPFGVMVDTHQLMELEESIESGFQVTNGRAAHLHLFDPERHPPGTHAVGWPWIRIFAALQHFGFHGTASVTLPREGHCPTNVALFIQKHIQQLAV